MDAAVKRRYLIYIAEDAQPEYKVNSSSETSGEETVMIFARTFSEVNSLRRQAETGSRREWA